MTNRDHPHHLHHLDDGDIAADELRAAFQRVARMSTDYLETVREKPVLPDVAPGDLIAALPDEPPQEGEALDLILDDYQELIEPALTLWNHPRFMAYFSITGSGPGILAETLTATTNVNAMLWRTSPAATELEQVVCDWLRRMLDLPEVFQGHINDTASIATMLSLAAAREDVDGLDVRQKGLAGRADVAPMTVYCSDQAHSSVDKAMIALGLGLDQLRRVTSDDAFRLDPRALRECVAKDRSDGLHPLAVVATAGTTSSTSIDPVAEIAEICAEQDIWLHVDAAYGGSAAICPEIRSKMQGLERADSIVLNPHKWLFTPLDCSVLFVRDLDLLRRAFSVVPEYLRTDDDAPLDLMDLGVQLGRRFRALKLWMVIRAFGVQGLQERIRQHCRFARDLAAKIEAESGFEVMAPVPFSTVCFRATEGLEGEERDDFNARLLAEVNRSRRYFLSHTRLGPCYVLRVAIGNIRTRQQDLTDLWEEVRRCRNGLMEGGA